MIFCRGKNEQELGTDWRLAQNCGQYEDLGLYGDVKNEV